MVARALEQGHAELELEPLDLLAQRGLGDAEPRGGAPEVKLVRQHGERAQQPRIGPHACSLLAVAGPYFARPAGRSTLARSMRRPLVLIAMTLALAAGCGDDDRQARPGRSRASRAPRAPPPDAGTQTGHGADRRERTEVPDSDASPPKATIVLESPAGHARARASEPGPESDRVVRLNRPALQGVTVGLDENGGVARVRVSVREQIRCTAGPGRSASHPLLPAPAGRAHPVEPGSRCCPPGRSAHIPIELSTQRCDGRTAEVRGELWGEAINGSGLEAVTPHLRFVFEP